MFYPIKVQSIYKTIEDCAIIELALDRDLYEDFHFQSGQYLTIEVEINGEKVRRCYSLCSSPLDKKWKIGVKKGEGGKFSSYANENLKVGDVLNVMPPEGKFHINIDPERKRDYVAFAAGSGITPTLSIIKTQLYSEPKSTFKLFYFNKTISSIMLREELEALKNQFIDRFEVFHFLTQQQRSIELFNGRLSQNKLEIIFKTLCDADSIDHYFTCGPEPMILLVEQFLLAQGVDKDRIHFELFGTDSAKIEKKKQELGDRFHGERCKISVVEGGKEITFETAKGSNSILDEALKNVPDLPYACKGGVCATCIAKLVKGDVDMLQTYGLEQEQIDEGYILTCQSLPLSDEIVVDYDV